MAFGLENGPDTVTLDGAYVREHLCAAMQQFDVAKHII